MWRKAVTPADERDTTIPEGCDNNGGPRGDPDAASPRTCVPRALSLGRPRGIDRLAEVGDGSVGGVVGDVVVGLTEWWQRADERGLGKIP